MKLNLLMPAVGLVLLVASTQLLRRERSWNALIVLLSGVSALIACLIWPVPNSTLFDSITGIVGSGRIVSELAMACGTLLQIVFLSSMDEAWLRWRRWLCITYLLFLIPYVLGWIATHQLTGYDLHQLYYHRYLGWPMPVLIMNLGAGVFVLYAYSTPAAIYASHLRAARRRTERFGALTGVAFYGISSTFGPLVIAQTLASAAGAGTAVLQALTALVIGMTCVLVAISPVLLALLRPAWHHVRSRLALPPELVKLRLHQEALINMSVFVSDLMVYAHTRQADVQAVAARLARGNFSAYQCHVALQAARLCALICTGTLVLAWQDASPESESEAENARLPHSVQEILAEAEQNALMHRNTLRVCGLILGPDRVPGTDPEHEPAGWRREAAAIIADELGLPLWQDQRTSARTGDAAASDMLTSEPQLP